MKLTVNFYPGQLIEPPRKHSMRDFRVHCYSYKVNGNNSMKATRAAEKALEPVEWFTNA